MCLSLCDCVCACWYFPGLRKEASAAAEKQEVELGRESSCIVLAVHVFSSQKILRCPLPSSAEQKQSIAHSSPGQSGQSPLAKTPLLAQKPVLTFLRFSNRLRKQVLG